MESTKGIKWADRSIWSRLIFVVSILYFICAVVVLLALFGMIPIMEMLRFNPMAFIVFSMISFFLATFISAYHLSIRIRRRKRKSDQ